MEITDIKTSVLRYRLKEEDVFGYSKNWVTERTAMILQVFTDEGIVGLGEAFGPPDVTAVTVEKFFKPMILGQDPFDVGMLWQKMYNEVSHFEMRGMAIAALSSIDIALWDIIGKSLDKPVLKLLGGSVRDKVMAYASHIYFRKNQDLEKEAGALIDRGFRAIKMKIGKSAEEEAERIKLVRDTVGDDVLLMVDANCSYNARTSIKVGKKLEKYNIYWFEEPVPPVDIEGYLEVKNALNTNIAGGETEFTVYGFKDLLSRKAVDIVQPDCCNCGGLTAAKEAAVLARAWNIQCLPHVWNAGVGVAAALQFAGSLPEYPPTLYHPAPFLFEFEVAPNPLRTELTNEPLILEKGYVKIPKKAGLGITLNEDTMNKYS